MKPGIVVRRMVLALWFGGGVALAAVAAPAAFRYAPDSRIAGDVVGGMLASWHWVSILAPLVLLAPFVARRGAGRRAWLAIAVFALCAGALQWGVDRRVSALRKTSAVPIRSLRPDDPFRRRFGALHGIAFGLMSLEILAAGTLVAVDSREEG